MIDRTYVLAAFIVLAAAIILALIGIALVRRFRASRWAEYDISLTERLERALGTGLPPLKVEPRAPAPSVEKITTATIDALSDVTEAPAVVAEAPQSASATPAPMALPVPPANLTPAPGEVWFGREPAMPDAAPAVSPAQPRPRETPAEPSVAPQEQATPDYELTAPVELRFAGDSGVVGIRADTEAAVAFRRMADELTEGIDDDERQPGHTVRPSFTPDV